MKQFRAAARKIAVGLGDVLIGIWPKKSFDYKESLIIFGEARSGSTWLMEMIQKQINPLIVWEPYHPVSGVIRKGEGDRPAITNEESLQYHQDFLKQYSSGKKWNVWTLSKSAGLSDDFLGKRNRVLVKTVRASKVYKQASDVGLKFKPIILRRHPLAILSSHRKKFGHYETEPFSLDKNSVKIKNEFSQEWSPELDKLLASIKTQYGRRLVHFCLVNSDFYQENDASKFIVIEYEDLVADPEKELNRIAQEWDFKVVVSGDEIRRGSSTSHKINQALTPAEQLKKWGSEFNENELLEMENVLQFFKWNYNVRV